MKEDFRFKVIKSNFFYMSHNYNPPTIVKVSKFFGIKGISDGFLEKIDDENYSNKNYISNKHFLESIKLFNQSNPYFDEKTNSLKFENKIFPELMEVDTLGMPNILFFKCNFKKGLIIKNSSINNLKFELSELKFLELENNKLIQSLHIHNFCKFDWITIQENKNNFKEIKVDTSNKINNFQFWNNILSGKFIFENNNNMNLSEGIYKIKDLNFAGNEFNCKFKITQNYFESFSLSGNNFYSKVDFLNNHFSNKLDFYNNDFQKRLKISSIDGHPDKIKIYKEIEKKIDLKYLSTNFNRFKPNIISCLNFNSNKINSFRIGYQRLDNFNIINLENYAEGSEINFGELIIKKSFSISSLRNYKRMRLYKINYGIVGDKNSKLIISDSTFGNSEFQEVNFDSFEEVKIFSSNLINIETIDVIWPEIISGNSLEQTRNTYRMLKHSLIKQEDRIQALKFYAKEMQTYYKQLIENKSKSNWQERLILGFNKNTSDFGLDWITPIIWMFMINAFFLLIYNITNFYGTIPNIIFNYNLTKFDDWVFYISDIIRSFYFISNIDLIIKDPNKLTLTLEIIRKVFISILLFQTIAAFRKYTRKI